MHKIFVLCFLVCSGFGQIKAQSNSIRDSLVNVKPLFWETVYMRTMPVCVYTGAGYLKDRMNQNIELGKNFGFIDVGVAMGRNAFRKDTAGNGTTYIEGKLTMDVAQYGIFSNEMVIGMGGVFNSKNYLMLELSYTILAQVSKKWGVGVITGYYDFSGDFTDNSRNMFGLFLRYGLIRSEGGMINNISRLNRVQGLKSRRRK